MDTLAVALRVAEEAIEEAISKAESHGDSLVGPPSSGGARGGGGGGGIGWEHTDCHEQVQMARGPRHCSLEQGMCGLLCAVARTAVTVTSHSRHSLSSTGQAE